MAFMRMLRGSGSLPLAVASLQAATSARADHIITAQEGLGPAWWGVALMGPIPLIAAGTVVYLLYRASRSKREAQGAPEDQDRGFTP